MTIIDAAPHLDSATPSFPLSANGMPHPLALTTASFKATMSAADKLIIGGRASDDDVQAQVSAACNALSDQIRVHLRPGGTALVGDFDIDNPDRAFMDHLLDWKLIHRSPQDLEDLFAQSRFAGAPVEVRREATGINLFASASRPVNEIPNPGSRDHTRV